MELPEGKRRVEGRGAGFIYFLEASDLGLIKIGWTKSLSTRMRDLRSGSPVELCLLRVVRADYRTEQVLLAIFSSLRVKGEWLRKDPVLVHFISQLAHEQNFSPLDLFSLAPVVRG